MVPAFSRAFFHGDLFGEAAESPNRSYQALEERIRRLGELARKMERSRTVGKRIGGGKDNALLLRQKRNFSQAWPEIRDRLEEAAGKKIRERQAFLEAFEETAGGSTRVVWRAVRGSTGKRPASEPSGFRPWWRGLSVMPCTSCPPSRWKRTCSPRGQCETKQKRRREKTCGKSHKGNGCSLPAPVPASVRAVPGSAPPWGQDVIVGARRMERLLIPEGTTLGECSVTVLCRQRRCPGPG